MAISHSYRHLVIKNDYFSYRGHQWTIMDKMVWAVTMVPALFILLSVLYRSSQPDHKFFRYPLDPIGIITFLILTFVYAFFIQLSKVYSGFLCDRLTTLNFLKGKKLVALGLVGPSVTGGFRLLDKSMTPPKTTSAMKGPQQEAQEA